LTIKSAVKRLLDWAILLLWLAAGCVIFLYAANMQDLSLGLAIMVLLAIGPIAVCLIALRNRKRAAQFFLIDAALTAGLLLFLDLLELANEDHPLRSLLLIVGFIAVFFGIPAIFWMITARRQWPPYIHSFSRWTRLAFGVC
jgi:uncharacterized membrane protein